MLKIVDHEIPICFDPEVEYCAKQEKAAGMRWMRIVFHSVTFSGSTLDGSALDGSTLDDSTVDG